VTIKKEEREMNQFQLLYIYTWRYQKETPCVAIFSYTKNSVVWGVLVPAGGGGGEERVWEVE
jgi:hypothetical protein